MLLAGTMPLILGVLMAIYWRSRKVYRGFGFWVFANFSVGLSYILLGLRGHVPDFFPVLVGNALIIYATVLIYDGIEVFYDRPSFDPVNHVIFGVYVLAQLFFTYLDPNTNIRIVLASGVVGLLDLRIANSLLRHTPARLRQSSRLVAVIFMLSALIAFARGVYAVYQTTPINLLSDRTLLAEALAAVCSMTIWTFYYLFLNSARVELDLEDAGQMLAASVDDSRREVEQLSLLEEIGLVISRSLNEAEILQSTVDAVVNRYGYAEAAISMLVGGDKLEIAAISGTEDIGYRPGYQQNLGEGIIGHVGQDGQVYISGDVERDPYYYTMGQRSGSAAAVPLLDGERVLGVLYVESTARDAFTASDIQTLRTIVNHVVTAVNKARLYARTQDHLVVMTTLHSISQIITSSLELDRIFQTVLQLLKDTFGYTHISIYLLEQDVLRLGAQIGYPEQSVLLEIPVTRGIVGRTVQTRQLQFVMEVAHDADFLRAAHEVESEICVPLFKKGSVLGVINVEAAPGFALTDRDADVLTALSGPIAIAIDNAHLHAEATALARIDGLTGLMNRRTFDQTIQSEIERAARYDYPLSLIILDIDEFKACNDQWGHPAGDALLRAMSKLIKGNSRSTDIAARYGGDEFAIILPNTAQPAALELGERLRAATQRLGLDTDAQKIPVGDYTISIGVASFPGNGRTAEELLLAADHAELNAKRGGKDRVCAAAGNQQISPPSVLNV